MKETKKTGLKKETEINQLNIKRNLNLKVFLEKEKEKMFL